MQARMTGYSIWINYQSGVNAVLITEIRGEPVDELYENPDSDVFKNFLLRE